MSNPDLQLTGATRESTPEEVKTPAFAMSADTGEATSLGSEAAESPPISDRETRSQSSNTTSSAESQITTSSTESQAPLSFSSASDLEIPSEATQQQPPPQVLPQPRWQSSFTLPPPLPGLGSASSSRPLLARAGSDPLLGRMQHRSSSPSNAPIAGTSTHRPRASRYADPDQHWLSEDEGEHFSRDVRRNGRAIRGESARASSDSDNGTGKDDEAKARALSLLAQAPAHQPISHKPSSITVDTCTAAGRSYTSLLPDLSHITPNLFQSLECTSCGDLMQDPVTLLCGHSLCLPCSAPKGSRRSRITVDLSTGPGAYPIAPPLDAPQDYDSDNAHESLSQPVVKAITADCKCPVPGCRKITKASAGGKAGLRTDFVLQKLTSLIRTHLALSDELDAEPQSPSRTEAADTAKLQATQASNVSSPDEDTKGELSSKRGMRKRKEGNYAQKKNKSADSVKSGPAPLLPEFVTDVLSELECQVCVTLLYEPMTTICGHTFCKKCLFRSLDHSTRCPLCRTELPGFNFFLTAPVNQTISQLLVTTFPVMYAERREMNEKEEADAGLDTPVFVCMVAFPSMPTSLHIYEPRYRLMMRRAMDSNKRFGMVLPSRTNGGLSQYGTMLEIQNLHVFDDGRSLVESVGVYRFKLLESGTLDGYTVGRIERIEDIPEDQEDELERLALERSALRRQAEHEEAEKLGGDQPVGVQHAQESTSAAQGAQSSGPAGLPNMPIAPTLSDPNDPSIDDSVDLTNAELLDVCKGFVEALRTGSTPWLLQRLNSSLPPMPEAPRDFTWWMAMLMPIDEHEKAKLLQITSYRLRLRLLVFWIQQMQDSWWFSRGCSIS